MTDFWSLLEISWEPPGFRMCIFHYNINDFNENVLLACTRAQFGSLRLSKEAQKEASEPQGAPLDASGEVLGRS